MSSKEFVAKHGLDIGNGKLLLSNTAAATKGQFPVYDGSSALTWRKLVAGTGIVLDLDTVSSEIKITTSGEIGAIITTGDAHIGGTTNLGNKFVNLNYVGLPTPSTPSDATADGGGIVLRGSTDKTILWSNASDQWNFNQGINITGDVITSTPFIRVASANTTGTNTFSGIHVQRGTAGNDAYVVWDEANDQWRATTVTVDGTETAFTDAPLQASVLKSSVAIGTSPFAITSTTVVPNLNVSQLLGNTWAIPGTIGSTTANSGTFTTLTVNTDFNTPHIDLNSTYTPAERRLGWNDTDGTLEFVMKGGLVTQQVGQESIQRAANRTAGTLTNGKAVRIVGSYGSRPSIDYAQGNSEVNSENTYGILTEDILTLSEGYVTTYGYVRSLNTSSLTEGTHCYLDPAVSGGLTSTKPVAPNHAVRMGWVVKTHATDGIILVNVANGFEMDELHDVKFTSLTNGDFLVYDSGNGFWKNSASLTLTAASSVTANGAGDVLTLNNNSTGNGLKVNGNVNISGTTTLGSTLSISGSGRFGSSTAVGNTTPTTVATFLAATYRSAEVLIQVVDSTNSKYHTTKAIIIHDGTNVWMSEYGTTTSAEELGTFAPNLTGGNVEIVFTATASSTKTVKVAVTAMTV